MSEPSFIDFTDNIYEVSFGIDHVNRMTYRVGNTYNIGETKIEVTHISYSQNEMHLTGSTRINIRAKKVGESIDNEFLWKIAIDQPCRITRNID